MTLLLKKEITNPMINGHGYFYEVHHDADGLNEVIEGQSFIPENEKEGEKYREQFINGDLNVYAIKKITKCEACGQPHEDKFEGDWICGIHAEDENEALEYYINNFC